MEFVFGTNNKIHILKTIGSVHTNFEGTHTVVQKFDNKTICDTFTIDKKYLSQEDIKGKCYDWYIIKDHSRYVDYFSPLKEQIMTDISDSQNATCELSEEMDIGMSDLENAICEQSEMIEQALSDIENALCELTEE